MKVELKIYIYHKPLVDLDTILLNSLIHPYIYKIYESVSILI